MTQEDLERVIDDVGSEHIVVMSHADYRKIAAMLTQEQKDSLNEEIFAHEYHIERV